MDGAPDVPACTARSWTDTPENAGETVYLRSLFDSGNRGRRMVHAETRCRTAAGPARRRRGIAVVRDRAADRALLLGRPCSHAAAVLPADVANLVARLVDVSIPDGTATRICYSGAVQPCPSRQRCGSSRYRMAR